MWRFLKTLKADDPATAPGIAKETEVSTSKRQLCSRALPCSVNNQGQPECPSMHEWREKTRVCVPWDIVRKATLCCATLKRVLQGSVPSDVGQTQEGKCRCHRETLKGSTSQE